MHLLPEQLHLFLGHQPGVIVLVPCERQAHALDGVGDEAGGLVALGLGRAQGLDDRLDVVAAEIGHQRAELLVVQLVDDAARLGAAEIGEQRLAPGRAALEGQCGVEAVRAIVDPAAQRLPARPREGGLQLAAVFDRDAVPAHVAEQALDPAEQPVGHDAVEALAIVVDDPPQVPDVVLPAFEQGFVDVALVELRVAGDRDVPAGRKIGATEPMQSCVVGHERGKGGHGDAETDGAGGEIDLGAVLDPRRVGLNAAELAKAFQLLPRLAAEQVVDGVEHRPGMRFDRDAVLRPRDLEIERREDGDRRRAGGLVPAHLQTVAVRADVIGVVDRPGGQPEQLLLELAEDVHPAFPGLRGERGQRSGRRVHSRPSRKRSPGHHRADRHAMHRDRSWRSFRPGRVGRPRGSALSRCGAAPAAVPPCPCGTGRGCRAAAPPPSGRPWSAPQSRGDGDMARAWTRPSARRPSVAG